VFALVAVGMMVRSCKLGIGVAYEVVNHARKVMRRLKSDFNCKVLIYWIPSHCGVELNDKADKLAKAAMRRLNQRVERIRQRESRILPELAEWTRNHIGVILHAHRQTDRERVQQTVAQRK